MRIEICSRKAILQRLASVGRLPNNTAVVSFYTPKSKSDRDEERVDYSGACERVFYVGIPDIDPEVLSLYGYTQESYLAEADGLASFILQAERDGYDLICQCNYGQSRSAACAAAILEYYLWRGIEIFADYRYYPNQLVYHKVYDALLRVGGESPTQKRG